MGATIFAPIEWTHYSIVLIAPLMVMAEVALVRRAVWIWPLVLGMVLLNLPPLAQDPYALEPGQFAVLRGHFFSEVICLLTLVAMALLPRLRLRSEPGV